MTGKRYLALLVAIVLFATMLPTAPLYADDDVFIPANSTTPIFEDAAHYSFEERAADMVARMSIAQKASQTISQSTAAITAAQLNANGGGAMNVPATKGLRGYTYWSEALHGIGSVSYPQNYTSASSWDTDLYYRQATEIGKMARELRGTTPTNLTFFSPTVNMGRDARWGRNEESFGEDPYLSGEMGARFIMGMEGKNQDGTTIDPDGYLQTITTLKHYVANNSERNRLSGGATTSLKALREYYTAPYRNAIKLSDGQSLMTAYSYLNLEPSVASSYLLDTLLRQTWGFSGYVVSDCDAVRTMVNLNYVNPRTGKVMTSNERLTHALAHGNDLECNGGYGSGDTYSNAHARMLEERIETDKGLFTENTYDVTVQRMMTARLKLGEVDGNIKHITDALARPGGVTAERANIAENMSTGGVVLLKNQANLLPLNKLTGNVNIAIVNGHLNQAYLGLYTQGSPSVAVNITTGIQNALTQANPSANITFSNIAVTDAFGELTAANETTIRNADYAIVVTGTNASYASEDGDRTSIKLPGNKPALIAAVGALNSKTISYTETCGPIEVISFENNVGAILWSSFGGIRKVGPGRVIAGLDNPSGKVTAIWHREVNDAGNSDVPSIYDYDLFNVDGTGKAKTGRTYMYNTANYTPGAVSYPFGFGLSYTDYVYSNLKITKKGEATDATTVSPDDIVTVSFSVRNNGTVAGAEVAQLYIAPPTPAAGQIRPIKMLKGFDKKTIAVGATENFSMDVKIGDLSFFNETTDKYEVDLGAYEIQVGPNSRDIPATMKKALTVAGTWTIVPAVVTAKPNQTGDVQANIEERVIFAKGAQVFPQLTVAMNDESLHGYIIKDQKSVIHQSKKTDLLTEGFGIVYTDKNPSWNVVSITGTAPNQVITATNAGVTTITATVSKNGVSASVDFPVYVVSDSQLVGIEVDGNLLEGFIGTRNNYTVEIAKDRTALPVVTPINFNSDLDVIVTPLTALPGTVKIDVTHKVSGKKVTYNVGFGYAPQSANFKADGAASVADTKQWELWNPTASGASFTANGLRIEASRGSLAVPEYPPQDLYMQTAAGDSWVAQTHVTLGAAYSGAAGPQTGLVIYDNASSYIRFVYERTSGTANALRVYNGTTQVNTASVTLSGNQLYLQVLYKSGVYSFRYSTNGTTWTTMATNVNAFYALPKIGVLANYNNTTPAATPFNATFEYLNIIKMLDVYPRLANINLGTAEIEGFSPEVFNYNVAIDDPFGNIVYDKIPAITAVLADPTHSVEVTPPTTLPGIGSITVSSPNGFATYNISFNYLPRSTNMTDGKLDDFWSIYRENATSGTSSRPWSIEKGKGLILPTQRYEPGRSADIENIFTMPASGNWEAVSKVHFPKAPNANYQQIAAIVWQDENTYIKFNHESNGGSQKTQAVAKTGGALNANFVTFYGSLAPMNADGSVTIYYKFKKEGNLYSCSFSSDGYEYDPPATIELNMLNPQLGFFATMNSSGTVIPTHAEFVCITEYYGLTDTQRDAAQYGFDNVVDYVGKDLNKFYSSVKGGETLVRPAVPHGYTMSLASDDTSVVDNTGKVVGAGSATLSATLTMGKFSETIDIDVDVPLASATMSETGGVLSVTANINGSENALAGNVMAAVYNAKGQLVTIQALPVALAANAGDSFNFTFDASNFGAGYTVQVFLWNSALVPLCDAITPTA